MYRILPVYTEYGVLFYVQKKFLFWYRDIIMKCSREEAIRYMNHYNGISPIFEKEYVQHYDNEGNVKKTYYRQFS